MYLQIVSVAMIAGLLIPIYEAWKTDNTWQLMLSLGSISSKVSIIILVISVVRDDWMIGVVALYRDWETDRKSTRLNSSH